MAGTIDSAINGQQSHRNNEPRVVPNGGQAPLITRCAAAAVSLSAAKVTRACGGAIARGREIPGWAGLHTRIHGNRADRVSLAMNQSANLLGRGAGECRLAAAAT